MRILGWTATASACRLLSGRGIHSQHHSDRLSENALARKFIVSGVGARDDAPAVLLRAQPADEDAFCRVVRQLCALQFRGFLGVNA